MRRHNSTPKIAESPAEAGANTHSLASALTIDLSDISALLAEYKPLVDQIAATQFRKLPAGALVQFNDLAQAGSIGLLQAAANYDSRHGTSFKTYAHIRINGAIIDEIRRYDWKSRGLNQKAEPYTRLKPDYT